MKIKICFFIFSLQFLLYSCDPVKYYQSQIPKYSDEVTVDPQNYFAVGFVLNIEDFQENENIYFIITLDEDDAKNDAENIDYMINFESTFDITEETTLTEFLYLERVDYYMIEHSRTSFYFKTSKENPNAKFFKFVIKSKTYFNSYIGFENIDKEEFEKETEEDNSFEKKFIIYACIFVVVFILVAVLGSIFSRKKSRKTASVLAMQQQMYGQQMYSQPQIYGQQMYGQQMNEQQQMIGQQGINEENNMNSVVQNNQTNPTPTNQNEISPMNKVDQNNQTNEKSPKS